MLHYVSLTFWGFYRDFFSALRLCLPDLPAELFEFEEAGRTAFYGRRFIAAYGVSICSDPVSPSPEGDYYTVTFPGEACERLGITIGFLAGLVAAVGVKHWRCTRLDWAIDGAPFSPRDVYNAFCLGDRGKVVSRLRADSWRWVESPSGQTVYLGSRRNERFLRCYNARGFTRLELELHAERADLTIREAWEYSNADAISQFMDGQMSDFVDFPDWPEWVEHVARCANRVKMPTVTVSVDKIKAWFERSVAFSVGCLVHFGHAEALRKAVKIAFALPSRSQAIRLRRLELSYML